MTDLGVITKISFKHIGTGIEIEYQPDVPLKNKNLKNILDMMESFSTFVKSITEDSK